MEITYNDLLILERDINAQANSPAYRYFNGQKIKRFYQINNIRLEALHTTINNLVKKYVLHDDKGNPVTAEENGHQQYQFENDENREAYKKAAEEFLSRTITLYQ